MLPKFTRSEVKEIAAVLREEKRIREAEPTDEEIAAAITAPLKLTTEEKKFLRKKENMLPPVAELKTMFNSPKAEKIISADFGPGASDSVSQNPFQGRSEQPRMAASRLDRPRSGEDLEILAQPDLIQLVNLGIQELGVDPLVYIPKVLRQLHLPSCELEQMRQRDLERFEKRLSRDIKKKNDDGPA